MKKIPVMFSYLSPEETPLPNPVLVSRQIDGLREVLRRMQVVQSDSLDRIINKKLEQFAHH